MRQNVNENNWSESIAIVPPVSHQFDAATNDSDKSFVVPDNEMWELNFAHVLFTSTATVGNRQILMELIDADNNIVLDLAAGALQAASLVRHYAFLQGIYRETSFVDNEIQVPLPQAGFLLPGWTLRVYDENAVDAAADDMTVSFQYRKYAV